MGSKLECSKRTQQLVTDAMANRLACELPDDLRVHRYAALLAAAERCDLCYRAQSESRFQSEYEAEGEMYGIVSGHHDHKRVMASRGQGRQTMSQLRGVADKVERDLVQLMNLFEKHKEALPMSLLKSFPLRTLIDTRMEIHVLVQSLDPKSESDQPLPADSTTDWTTQNLALLWWQHGFSYRGRWRHQFNLARAWGVSHSRNEASFEAFVSRLAKKSKKRPIPDPRRWFAPEDRNLFVPATSSKT